jgi:hypothetical protein
MGQLLVPVPPIYGKLKTGMVKGSYCNHYVESPYKAAPIRIFKRANDDIPVRLHTCTPIERYCYPNTSFKSEKMIEKF